MKKYSTKIKTLFYIALTTFSVHAWSGIAIIAETGQPAAGFSEEFIYWNIDGSNAAIGASGHVAFSGAVDVSINSTENNTNAVWAGLPGQFKVIIRESESPVGFPNNVLFERMFNHSPIAVSRSGHVGFLAQLKGAGQGQQGLLAHINGTTIGIMRNGDPAPGFPSGAQISLIHDFSISDAGIVIIGAVLGPNIRENFAVWFYDFESINLLPPPVPGCINLASSIPRINDSGEIVLASTLLGEDGRSACSIPLGVFKWKNGAWESLVTEDDNVPNMSNVNLTFFGEVLFASQLSINDEGSVIFSVGLDSEIDLIGKKGIWIKENSEEPKLLVLGKETLQGDTNKILANAFNLLNFRFTNDNFSVVNAVIAGPTGGIIGGTPLLLAGFPKNTQPYSSLNETGETQLDVIAQLNEQPPGLESTWFYSRIGESVALNRKKQFVFSGIATDGATNNMVTAIWRGSNHESPRLKAMQGMKVIVNGEERFLEQIGTDFFSTTTDGRSARISENGDFLMDGALTGSFKALMLLLDDSREQRIFTLAEQLFPQFFSPANVDDRLLEGFEYRFYPNTNAYIGIRSGEVFVLGEAFGPGLQRIGTIDETLQLLESM